MRLAHVCNVVPAHHVLQLVYCNCAFLMAEQTNPVSDVRMPFDIRQGGYKNFGSFFTEVHVEELVSQADLPDYVGPQPPFCTSDLLNGVDERLPLGRPARNLFMIDFATWTFLNHGAFGGVCMPAYQEAARWREHCERQPLTFLDRELFPQLIRVMREVADFMNARTQDLVFVPNATTGLNVVIQSCGLGPGDVLYMLDIGYGSVKKMAAAAMAAGQAEAQKPKVVMGQVQFPISGPEELVDIVARSMPPNTKLAVFDAVTSNTALVLPIQELVELCKSRGVPVLIDAAHALGQLPVDLQQLGADYYVTNCHKWLAGPRGSAVLWVHPQRKATVKPLVVSHGSGCGFTSDFIWDGCRDYAPYLALSSAISMWRKLGLQRCRSYCSQLLAAAVQLLTSSWGTSTLAPLSMCANMALVGLPHALVSAAEQGFSTPAADLAGDEAAISMHQTLPVGCANQMQSAAEGSMQAGSDVHGKGSTAGAASAAGPAITGSLQQQQQQQDLSCQGTCQMDSTPGHGSISPAAVHSTATSAHAKHIQDLLHHKYHIECPVKCVQGRLFVRISVQVYNDLQDYQTLCDAVAEMVRL